MQNDSFNTLIKSVQGSQGQFTATVTASWLQGRASFGGLVAALAVEAMRQAPQASKPLRSIQVLFSSPVGEGSVTINTQLLREGRSVTTMRADLSQQGQICCSVMASFGTSRSSAVTVDADSAPQLTAPEALQTFPYIKGLTPEFIQHFDLRWAQGDHPFTGCQETSHIIRARFKEPGTASIPHLIAIADTPPPIPLSMLSSPANGSSLSWALEFLSDDWQATLQDWWYIETTLDQCSEGYAKQRYKIWTPNGQPVASGQQIMTIFG